MGEEQTAQRPIHPTREVLAKPVAVEAADAGPATIDAVEKTDLAAVSEERHRLLVETLVDVVAVLVVQAFDRMDVFEPRHLARELGDALLERCQRIGIGHGVPLGPSNNARL